MTLYKIHIKPPMTKCVAAKSVAKRLIRRGPDGHAAGTEIFLLEQDLKTFSKHCRPLAASLTNAADFFLE